MAKARLPKKAKAPSNAFLAVLKGSALRFLRAEGMAFAGYLSFLTMLAVIPALAVLYWVSEHSSVVRTGEQFLRDFLFSNLFPDAARSVLATIERMHVNTRALGLTGIGILLIDLLFKAQALNAALRRISGEAAWGGVLRLVGALVVIFIAIPLAVGGVVWTLDVIEEAFFRLAPRLRSGIAHGFNWLNVSLPLIAGLTIMYRLMLPQAASWRATAICALLATIFIELARIFLGSYLAHSAQFKNLYGAFGALPVLLLSIYSMWSIVLVGAAVLAELANARKL